MTNSDENRTFLRIAYQHATWVDEGGFPVDVVLEDSDVEDLATFAERSAVIDAVRRHRSVEIHGDGAHGVALNDGRFVLLLGRRVLGVWSPPSVRETM